MKSFLRDLIGTADDPARIALDLAKDEKIDPRLRIDCALGLIPFVHPKLSYAEVNATHTSVQVDSATVLQELEERLNRIGRKPPLIEAERAEPDPKSGDANEENPVAVSKKANRPQAVSATCPDFCAEKVG